MSARICVDRIALGRIDGVSGAELFRELELGGKLVDRDDHAGACDSRALDDREANAAGAEDGDGRAGRHFGGVERGADAGHHAASDERGAIERHVVANFHQRVFMQQHFFGVARQVGKLIDHLAVLREARLVAGSALGGGLVRAQIRMTRHAVLAVAAKYRQAGDYVIAGLEVGNLRADFFDDAGGLVAEHGGRRPHVEAVDEMEIAVAHAAGDGAHDDFALFGFVDFDLLDGEWLTGTVEDSSFHFDLLLFQ